MSRFLGLVAAAASELGVVALPPTPLPLSLPSLLGALLAALAGYLLSRFLAYEYRCRVPAIPGCSPPPRTKSLLSRYCAADTLEALRHPDALRERRHAELGDVYSSVFLGNEFVAVRGFQNVRLLLNAEHGAVEVAWPDAVRRLLGPRSVSTTYFDAHRALRRTMAPALGPRAVAAMVPRLAETVERHLGQWCEGGGGSAASQPGGGDGRGQGEPGAAAAALSGVHACKSLTFEIALDAILGFDPARLTRERLDEAHGLFDAWIGGFVPGGSALLPWGKLRRALAAREGLLALIDEFLTPMLAQMRRERKGEKERGEEGEAASTVMGRLVDAALLEEEAAAAAAAAEGNENAPAPPPAASALSLDHAALLDVGLNLLFAGHDTSATTLCLLLRELVAPQPIPSGESPASAPPAPVPPPLLQRLRDEQASVVAQLGSAVTSASLAAAPLASACVKEMLRLRPIVPQLFRRAQRDIALDAGKGGQKVAVRAGSVLVLDVGDTLLQDERWAGEPRSSRFHPSRFEPERWLVASSSSSADGGETGEEDAAAASSLRRAGAHIPFGGGARMCAGYVLATAELEAALALLCRGCEWEVVNPHAPLVSSPLPLPSDGLVMRIWPLGSSPSSQKNKDE